MQFYEQWAKNPDYNLLKDNLYNFFYDQAHFIKEFNRFTGLSPLKFAKSENEFGKIFYKAFLFAIENIFNKKYNNGNKSKNHGKSWLF